MSTSVNDLANLSDHDVKILHDIVNAAEQSKASPFRALFSAYEDVLAQHGVPKDNDQIYLRFLLRMGENRKEGRTIFEQFESLLARLGIHVAFDEEERAVEDRASAAGSREDTSPPDVKRLQTQSFRPARRHSFDSGLNESTSTKRSLDQLQLLSDKSRSLDDVSYQDPRITRPSPAHIARPTPPILKSSSQAAQETHKPSHGYGLVKSNNVQNAKALPEPASAEDQTSDHAETEEYEDNGEDASDSGEEVDAESSDSSPTLHDALQPPRNLSELIAPEDERERHAKALRFHHVAVRAVSCFRQWRAVAEQSHSQHQVMGQSAQARHAVVLKRFSINQWRAAMDEERLFRETESFYKGLEVRAAKARGLFLLSKAFTHWAQCASEEILRKGAAQKHVLKARYFSAWREISVVNEMKVRRARLSKFYGTWMRKTSDVMRLEDKAADFRSRHRAVQAYHDWFWHFCERRAPLWHTGRLQRAILSKWREAARAARIRQAWAQDFRSLELQRQCLVHWTKRSHTVQDSIFQAVNFRQQRLLEPTVEALQRELRLAPLQAHYRRIADARIARSALTKWSTQSRAVTEAGHVNQSRILRNAWTAWNDALRTRALVRTINDRIMVHALYKWVLAERLALCDRVRDEKLVASVFSRWRTKTDEYGAALGRAHHHAILARKRRQKASIVKIWSSLAKVATQEGDRAQEARDQKLLLNAFGAWTSARSKDVANDKWAERARFYVLASSSIKTWRERAQETRRSKRRESYAAIRRRVKGDLARRVLGTWRDKTKNQTILVERAESCYGDKLSSVVAQVCHHWRTCTIAMQDASMEASIVYNVHLLRSHMLVLRRCSDQWEAHASTAETFLVESSTATAKSCFRKLSLQLYQVRRLDDSAGWLEQRTRRQHFKSMLGHWAETSKERRAMRNPEISQAQSQMTGSPTRLPSSVARAEQWTSFPARIRQLPDHSPQNRATNWGQAPDAATTTVPSVTPAYLRTPLRHTLTERSARFGATARTQAQAHYVSRTVQGPRVDHSVPPTTPAPPPTIAPQTQPPPRTQITPFMSRLRTQYGGNLSSTNALFNLSSRFTRGASGLSRGFGASLQDTGAGGHDHGPGGNHEGTISTGGPGMFDTISEPSEEDENDDDGDGAGLESGQTELE